MAKTCHPFAENLVYRVCFDNLHYVSDQQSGPAGAFIL